MTIIPPLDRRFLAPDGWTTGRFINPDTGHDLHYGYAIPSGKPQAVVVCLGGLSEYSEKYFETAHDMLDRGHAFFIMDWQYQGRSGRMANFPHRRHSDGFDDDISDFEHFIEKIVKPLAASRPFVMLGHSMGGHLGLRYLLQRPEVFSAAAFSAPFLGIYNFGWPMKTAALAVTKLRKHLNTRYVFFGRDWDESGRKKAKAGIFSTNPIRNLIHDAWLESDPDLRIGSVTYGWVLEALKSCAILTRPDCARSITIPVLIGLAGKETIVDNNATRIMAKNLPNATLLEFPQSGHEILMEDDAIRDEFLKAFDVMIGNIKN